MVMRWAGQWGSPEAPVKEASGWFREAVAGTGGFVLPGRPRRGGADLLVGCDGVEVRVGSTVARLPWERFWSPWSARVGGGPGHARDWWSPPRGPADINLVDGWTIGYYGYWGPGGIVVIGREASAVAVASVAAAASAQRNGRWRADEEAGAVALWANAPRRPGDGPELDVLIALATALGMRPGLRAPLARRDVGARLVAEMAEGMRCSINPGGWTAYRSVLSALDRLGYRHPIGGRPLPGDPLPDLAAVVEAVLARDPAGVASFPVAPRVVAGIVQRWYLGVEPWPFTALVQAAGPPRPGPEPPRGP